MKKICFVTTVSITLKAFILDMAQYLHNNGGFEITFVCSSDLEFEKTLPEYIRFYPIPMKRGISLEGIRVIGQLYHLFRKEKFDIVQYSTPNASFYCSIAAFAARIKVRLYCQWGLVFTGFSGLKRVFFRKVEALVCRLSTFVEPDSFGNLELCRQEGFYDERKSRVIWNGSACGIDLNRFDVDKKEKWREKIRNLLHLDGYFVFGFVGRVNRDKGIFELIRAFKRMKDLDCVLLIIGVEEKLEDVDGLYRWAKLNHKVIFTGEINLVEEYYAAMDCFILPSHREGFGSVVIEAEAMAVPVIVTDIPGPSEAVIDGKTGYKVTVNNDSELYEKMLQVFRNGEINEKIGLAGFEFVKNRFNREKFFEILLEDRKSLVK